MLTSGMSLWTCLLLVFQIPVPEVPASQADLLSRARELVVGELRRQYLAPENFELRVLGNPVLYPDHGKYHSPRRAPSRGTQGQFAAVRGTLRAADGPVQHAVLTLSGDGSVPRNVAITDRGSFEVEGLPAGKYRLTAESYGFKITEHRLELKPGERREIRIDLKPGTTDETIVVSEPRRVSHPLPTGIAAIVSFAAVQGGRLHRVFRVSFAAGEGGVEYNPDPFELPLDEREWLRVAERFEPFYSTALDIERNSDRFYTFLSDDMHACGISEQPETGWMGIPSAAQSALSGDDLRRLVALWLDLVVHQVWMTIEGIPMEEFIPEAPKDVAGVRLRIDELAAAVRQSKSSLSALGLPNDRHSAVCRDYIAALMGKPAFIKIRNGYRIRPFQEDAALYRVVFGTVHLFFRIDGNRIQIAHIFFD